MTNKISNLNPIPNPNQDTKVTKHESDIKKLDKETEKNLPFSPSQSQKSINVVKKPFKTTLSTHSGLENIPENLNPKAIIQETTKSPDIDQSFICNKEVLSKTLDHIESALQEAEKFNTPQFLIGTKAQDTTSRETNEQILLTASKSMRNAAEYIAKSQNIPLDAAFKQLIGALDTYDLHPTNSTFVLRTAILLESPRAGVHIDSWMVYTKAGKPKENIWPFLDNWKNWVPEAQGSMAKFSEAAIVSAHELAKEHPGEKVVLLKGGFGAGKTRLTKSLFQTSSPGVVAPDSGKRVVRRTMETTSHAAAHIQGSQLAYKLFDDLIQQTKGTVVYDSSLSSPSDVSAYLSKCKRAGKQMIIYDVARDDRARTLAVLKRDIKGEDPRIPPDFIIQSAIKDKMNRVKCMEVILNDTTKDSRLSPEYHFHGADSKGWNTEEVMVLQPQTITLKEPETGENTSTRLALEGIILDQKGNKISLTLNETKLKQYYNDQFERPVQDVMKDLSTEEQEIFHDVFSKRTFSLDSKNTISDASTLYDALSPKVQKSISKSTFVHSFDNLKPETTKNFFASIKSSSLSYLDLPLRAALSIHQHLQTDPWN